MTTTKYSGLKNICLADTQELLQVLANRFKVSVTNTAMGEYVYVDNGATTLAVAHLDTVADSRFERVWNKATGKMDYYPMPSVHYKEFYLNSRKKHKRLGIPSLYTAGDCVQSIALDDRLGVWMIVDVLPELGVKCDYLFTTNEELGMSTAGHFETSKKYNWIFEFDRRGFDPVLYGYDTPQLRQLLFTFGYKVTHGSFSDISELEHLGCKAINFGVGYDWEHTARCSASIPSVLHQAKKFFQFWAAMKDTRLTHTPRPPMRYTWTGSTKVTKADEGEWKWTGRDDEGLNWAYLKNYGDLDDPYDNAKTAFDLGEVDCELCGDMATHIIHLDADYAVCDHCYRELTPDSSYGLEDESGYVDENGRYHDTWDYNERHHYNKQSKKGRNKNSWIDKQ